MSMVCIATMQMDFTSVVRRISATTDVDEFISQIFPRAPETSDEDIEFIVAALQNAQLEVLSRGEQRQKMLMSFVKREREQQETREADRRASLVDYHLELRAFRERWLTTNMTGTLAEELLQLPKLLTRVASLREALSDLGTWDSRLARVEALLALDEEQMPPIETCDCGSVANHNSLDACLAAMSKCEPASYSWELWRCYGPLYSGSKGLTNGKEYCALGEVGGILLRLMDSAPNDPQNSRCTYLRYLGNSFSRISASSWSQRVLDPRSTVTELVEVCHVLTLAYLIDKLLGADFSHDGFVFAVIDIFKGKLQLSGASPTTLLLGLVRAGKVIAGHFVATLNTRPCKVEYVSRVWHLIVEATASAFLELPKIALRRDRDNHSFSNTDRLLSLPFSHPSLFFSGLVVKSEKLTSWHIIARRDDSISGLGLYEPGQINLESHLRKLVKRGNTKSLFDIVVSEFGEPLIQFYGDERLRRIILNKLVNVEDTFRMTESDTEITMRLKDLFSGITKAVDIVSLRFDPIRVDLSYNLGFWSFVRLLHDKVTESLSAIAGGLSLRTDIAATDMFRETAVGVNVIANAWSKIGNILMSPTMNETISPFVEYIKFERLDVKKSAEELCKLLVDVLTTDIGGAVASRLTKPIKNAHEQLKRNSEVQRALGSFPTGVGPDLEGFPGLVLRNRGERLRGDVTSTDFCGPPTLDFVGEMLGGLCEHEDIYSEIGKSALNSDPIAGPFLQHATGLSLELRCLDAFIELLKGLPKPLPTFTLAQISHNIDSACGIISSARERIGSDPLTPVYINTELSGPSLLSAVVSLLTVDLDLRRSSLHNLLRSLI